MAVHVLVRAVHPIFLDHMNKLDNGMIEIEGKYYQHDYEFDCYYRVSEPVHETLKERMIKIAAALMLLLIIVIGSKYYF
jgi:hypothetical protein